MNTVVPAQAGIQVSCADGHYLPGFLAAQGRWRQACSACKQAASKLEQAFDKSIPTGYTTAKFSFAAKENI